jgi:multidrug efflux system membrane fusion protein
VFVVQPDKTVAQRAITLGPGDAKNASVTQGLKPGDTVVIDGADRLRDGAQVELPNATAPVGKPSAATGGTGAPAAGAGAGRGARLKLLQSPVCKADVDKYCSGKTGRDMFTCIRDNRDSFSQGCQDALKALRHHGGGGGGSGGGFGGGG